VREARRLCKEEGGLGQTDIRWEQDTEMMARKGEKRSRGR